MCHTNTPGPEQPYNLVPIFVERRNLRYTLSACPMNLVISKHIFRDTQAFDVTAEDRMRKATGGIYVLIYSGEEQKVICI